MPVDEPLPTIRKYRRAQIDLETDPLRLLLFDASQAYTIDDVNHEFVSDVIGTAATELSDASYSRQDVTNVQVFVDGTDGEVAVDADDVTFPSLGGGEEIQGWILYKQVGGDDTTPADDPIIAIEDEVTNSSGNAVTTNGSDVVVQFNSEGIVTVSNN